jgi:hypothetical protein
MAKFDLLTVIKWSDMASKWLKDAGDPGTLTDIYLGAEAWAIAHRCGITRDAYTDQTVVDAHIVTALKQIFPNAVFKDKYSY